MFFIILAVDNNIIWNSNHAITAVKYLVCHSLEIALYTGQAPGEAEN